MISICYKGRCYREIQAVEKALYSLGTRPVFEEVSYPTTGDCVIIGAYGKVPASRPIIENGRKLYRLPMLAIPYSDESASSQREFDRSLAICTMFMLNGKMDMVACSYRYACSPLDFAFAVSNYPPGSVLSFDIETTGLSPHEDRVVSASVFDGDVAFTCHFGDDESGLVEVFTSIASTKADVVACNSKFEIKWMLHKAGVSRVMYDVQVDDCLLKEDTHHGLELIAGYTGNYGYDLEMEEFLVPIIKTAAANKNQRYQHRDAPFELLERYNQDDCIVTGRAFHITSKLLDNEPSDQTFVRDMLNRGQVVLANMENRGMFVDPEVAIQVKMEYEQRASTMLALLQKEAAKHGMVNFNPASAPQRSKLLYDVLGLPVLRLTNDKWVSENDYHKGWWVGKGNPSTDAITLDMLSDVVENDVVKALTEYASIQVLLDGIITRCNLAAVSGDGMMRTDFSATKLVTGQLSSSNPPMQNVPKDPIRRMFKSRFKGGVIMEIDYSQLHLRIIGNLALCPGFIDAYLSDTDLHSRTAAMVIARQPEEMFNKRLADGDQEAESIRDKAKRTNFSIIFEVGSNALATKLKLSPAKCKEIITRWFETFPEIQEQIDRQHRFAEEHGYVISPFGRIRHLPFAMQNRDRYAKLRAFRQAGDYLISNSGRYICYYGMVLLDEYMRRMKMKSMLVLQVHDSIVLDVHPSEKHTCIELANKFCVEETSSLCDWMNPIPLKMDGVMSNRWWKKEEDAVKFSIGGVDV